MSYEERQEHLRICTHYLIKLRTATNESRWVFVPDKPVTFEGTITYQLGTISHAVTFHTLPTLLPSLQRQYPELFI